MSINSIGFGAGHNQFYTKQVPFEDFVKEAYNGIPDVTTTVEEKQRAISAKLKILSHPQCPELSKNQIRAEIAQIREEIKRMQ